LGSQSWREGKEGPLLGSQKLSPVSFATALSEMQASFRDGDIAGLRKAYLKARSDNFFLRHLLRLIERFYPVASRETLERIGIDWEYRLPKETEEVLRSARVIFYGNHPSMLTPFLIAARLDRTDIRILMMGYVGHLIPSLSRLILPLELPLNRPLTELRRGGMKHLLALWLVSRLNRRSLKAAIDHVRSGGCVAIFPAGGGRANRRWYPGIGTLVKDLAKESTDRPIYLVPIREYNSSNHRVYASLAKTKAARIRRRLLYRRPVRIEFADPIRLDGLPIDPSSAHRIYRRPVRIEFADPIRLDGLPIDPSSAHRIRRAISAPYDHLRDDHSRTGSA